MYRIRLLVLGLCLAPALGLWAQSANKATVSGYIRDQVSGEVIIGATVSLSNAQGLVGGGYTNEYGFFSLTVPFGTYTLQVNYLGFKPLTKTLELQVNQRLELELLEEGVTLNEIEIVAEPEDNNVTDVVVGRNQLSIGQVQKLPALLGEVDVIKTIQLLPGIQFGGEGNTGFYVRGGNYDQNLIQLDEAPVYNASHLLGFFSVFNADALKDVEVYKAGIPPRYGGRLASVVDIRMKEGSPKKYGFKAGIGLISSRATFEGPLVRDKSSFIVSGRRTYADLFLLASSDPEVRENRLYFYDFNAKVNFDLGANDRVFVSGYFGRDVFKFGDQFGFDWGNRTATARWNHIFNDRLFSNLTLIYSDFDYSIQFSVDDNSGAKITSGIRDLQAKYDLTYFISPELKAFFGASYIDHRFKPGSLTPTGEASFFNAFDLAPQDATEAAGYVELEQTLSPRLSLRYGLRTSWFGIFGPGTTYTYDPEEFNDPLIQTPTPIDSVSHAPGELIQSYLGFEPRAALRYTLTPTSSLKASYDRTYQYLHLASNATASLPTDLYIPSSQYVRPQIADQWSLGYFRNFEANTYETSVEVYYKRMFGQLDLKDGADILLNSRLETQLRQGYGWSYGAEFFVQKNKGDLTGWVSYTLSWTEREIVGINQGRTFYAKNDRRHNVSVVGTYEFSPRVTLSGTWVYLTGNAVTFPEGKYVFNGNPVAVYSERNGYRLPDYHRMDVSLTLQGRRNDERKFKREWNFSIYNLYWRKNAFFIDFRQSEDDPSITEVKKVYLFGLIPSITYNLSF